MTDEDERINTEIQKVTLTLHNAINCDSMFKGCSNLTDVDLTLPHAVYCQQMFYRCPNLTNVKIDAQVCKYYNAMFSENPSLESVDLNLPQATNCYNMFLSCRSLVSANLNIPNATGVDGMFYNCSALESVNLNMSNITRVNDLFYATNFETLDLSLPSVTTCNNLIKYNNGTSERRLSVRLDLPNATDCYRLLDDNYWLENVILNMPKLSNYTEMFRNCPLIETIDVTIPTSIVSGFKTYVEGLELENLTSFIINGEEQID